MQEKSENMEQAILEIAERLFLEKGFAMTSTTMIAKEAGCNQALVHYYFRTKENLFKAIFENKFRFFFEQILDFQFSEEVSFKHKVKQIIETHFDLLSKNRKMVPLLLNELTRKPEHINSIKQNLESTYFKLIKVFIDELEKEKAAGKVRQDIEFLDLVITIITLNLSIFILLPIGSEILQLNDERKNYLLKHRRQENVKIIYSYLGYDIKDLTI
jgi:AcrR family transcriptional regulator